MKNSFFLIIPPQKKNPEQLKQFQESALKRWVDELPTANPSLATRLFHDFIVEFNQLELDSALRLEGLEILRASYIIIEDYLRARLIQSSFPKAESEHKIMDILVAIEKEVTLGYWIVVRDLSRKDSWFQSKNTALSIQRCLKGLNAIILTCGSLYRAIPDWVWLDCHSLYKLAEQLNKLDVKVPSEFNDSTKNTTIENTYRQLLLFSLSQPQRLMQREILQVYHFLETLCSYLSIQAKALPNEQHGTCVVSLDEDKPPAFQSIENTSNDNDLRYLQFDKLLKAIKSKDKLSEPGMARFSAIGALAINTTKLPIDLLNYLEQRWKAANLPEQITFPDRLNRYLTLGLDAAFNLQSNAPDHEAEYLAHSASEQALSCDFNKTGMLSVGSLVSLRKLDAPEYKRSLGIVSKITTFRPDNKLNFEIELLATQYYAVSFEFLEEKKPQRKKALLYGQKEPGKEEKSFIIIESFMLKDGDIVRMFIAQENYPIILKDRKNIGLGYWQFECRRMAEELSVNKRQGYDFI